MSKILDYHLSATGPIVALYIAHQDCDFTNWLKKGFKVNDMTVQSAVCPEITDDKVYLLGTSDKKSTTKVFRVEEAAEFVSKTKAAIDATVNAYTNEYKLEEAKKVMEVLPAEARNALLSQYVITKPIQETFFPGSATYADFAALFAKFAASMPRYDGGIMLDDKGGVYFRFGISDKDDVAAERLGTPLLAKKRPDAEPIETKLYLCQ